MKEYEMLTYHYPDDESCISIEEYKILTHSQTFDYQRWVKHITILGLAGY